MFETHTHIISTLSWWRSIEVAIIEHLQAARDVIMLFKLNFEEEADVCPAEDRRDEGRVRRAKNRIF